jgi:hypothetical protein
VEKEIKTKKVRDANVQERKKKTWQDKNSKLSEMFFLP